MKDLNGAIFYYAAEKPVGTPKETNCGKREFAQREEAAMQETLNRLARYAHRQNKRLLVLMDQINEKERRQRLPLMYAHIYGRAANHPEMRRIVEPPMHIDSQVSSNIQFADWVAALVSERLTTSWWQILDTSGCRTLCAASCRPFLSLRLSLLSLSSISMVEKNPASTTPPYFLGYPTPILEVWTKKL